MHVVRMGETQADIARAYGVPMRDLVLANPHKPIDVRGGALVWMNLYEGERVFLPGETPAGAVLLRGRLNDTPIVSGMAGDGPADDSAWIQATLKQAQISQSDINKAIQAYTGLDANAQGAILNIVQGGKVNLATLAPLIAAGLSATGVGAPIVAAVAAALPIIQAIANIFAGGDDEKKCAWYVGAVCMSAARPYGPDDPKWQSFERFEQTLKALGTQVGGLGGGESVSPWYMDAAFPLYTGSIGCELKEIPKKPDDPVYKFLGAYYRTWQANAEFEINGYKAANPHDLLTTVVNAWNATHAPTSTFTFQPHSPPSHLENEICFAQGKPLNDPATVTYVSMLLDGAVDGQDQRPVTINTGAQRVILGGHSLDVGNVRELPTGSSAGGMATGTKVLIGTAVVGGAAVGLWLLLGKPLTVHALKAAISHAVKHHG
jgi:hypothetical protein